MLARHIMSSHLLKLATRSYSLSHLRGSSPGAPQKVDGLLRCCNEGVTTVGLASCSVGIFVLFLLFSFNSPNSGDNPLNRRLLRRLSLLSTFDVIVPRASTKLVTEFERKRAETQIRSLEGLGVKGGSYSILLTPIPLKQIPSELVSEFNLSQKNEGFDLSALLWFLHLEIRSRELAFQKNTHKPSHYSPPPQDRTKNKGSYFPGQSMKPPPNIVQSRPHLFPTLLGKVEPLF
ncbi:uncharacterized protein TNCV_748691 [Trichonephila clavipes]|nr:uncharacterized protein TNCV_748691 [Trichonephila clavipes]